MQNIVNGVRRFQTQVFPNRQDEFAHLAAKQQRPEALFITCSDSRVNPNLITQTEPGDLFLLRNAGNIVPPHGAVIGGEAATIEYAVCVLEVRNIVICGHSQCGAVKAILEGSSHMSELPAVKTWCQHAEAMRYIVQKKYQGLDPEQLAIAATEENVLVQMNNLSTHPCVAARLATGELKIYGWYYDIRTGQMLEYDQSSGWFREMDGAAQEVLPMPVRARNGKPDGQVTHTETI